MDRFAQGILVLLGGFVLGAGFMFVASSAMFKNREIELRLEIARMNGRFDVIQYDCPARLLPFTKKTQEEEKK